MKNDSQPQLSRADTLLSAGQFQQAQNIYLAIIQADPEQAEAYFKLAWIADKEGRSLPAKKYLQKAYDKNPNNKEYLQALCALLSKAGRHSEAVQLCEQYLKIDTKQDDVFFLYATLLIATSQFEAAVKALNTSINLNPGKLPYYMKLGELLFHLGQYKDALALYKSAYDKGLQSEGLYLNLAKLYTDFGQQQAAKDVLAKGMIFYPRKLSFPYRLQSLDKLGLKDDFYQTLMKKEAQIPEQDRFYFHWLLAQHENIQGAPENEMSHLLKAHEAYKKLGNFKLNTETFMQLIRHLHQLSSSLIPEQLTPLSVEASPIFIVGIPRCGSTLVESILCSGPEEVQKGEETGVVFHCATNNLKTVNDKSWEHFKLECDAHFQRLGLSNSGQCFTDKSLENIFMIDLLLALYPNAKIVYCERNPLACSVSILRNNLAVLPWAHDPEAIFNYVDLSLKAIDSAIDKYPGRILRMQYETLAAQPELESKKLMQFCDLPWDESCLNFHKRSDTYSKTASHIQIRKAINTDSIDLYQKYRNVFKAFEPAYPWLNVERQA